MMTSVEMVMVSAAVVAILMVGTPNIGLSLLLYGLETLLIAIATALSAKVHGDFNLLYIALLVATCKAAGIPLFLRWTTRRLQISRDLGAVLTPPLAMHLSIMLLAVSFWLTQQLPAPQGETSGWYGAAAGISLLFTGLVLMLTRRLAISQILGFLVIENGIFTFALTQTHGMPMFVEMGVMLDVLAGVMIAGLLTFRIQKSFEHIDVAQLTDLRD
ncbi:MAG TPA: hypothetical protein PKZ32_10385 [Candidatus Melainabacteria bacterium]|nr:hypothetical protein [Candidatus Melainabacteria bacterium]